MGHQFTRRGIIAALALLGRQSGSRRLLVF
jgi:hypothetical protein